MRIEPLHKDQVGELFSLQRCCFVDEAVLYGTPAVPALEETMDAFAERHRASKTFVGLSGRASGHAGRGRIVGAVSIRNYRSPHPDIERLMVAPDVRRRGVASTLLDAAEASIEADGHDGVQLIVGEIATKNRAMYESAGYETTGRHVILDTVGLLTMTKLF